MEGQDIDYTGTQRELYKISFLFVDLKSLGTSIKS